MRTIDLNGYIDETVWFGDEITPDSLREALYGADNQFTGDVQIRLNSYGGSCNAATRMHDLIREYPGAVNVVISGTAASAATVVASAGTRVEMTPGSLYMIHLPSTVAWGDERDMRSAVDLLKACSEAILNIYERRASVSREQLWEMMAATTWMDAKAALEYGFIDGIAANTEPALTNAAAPRAQDRMEAEQKVQAWLDRRKPKLSRHASGDDLTSSVPPAPEPEPRPDSGGTVQMEEVPTTEQPEPTGTPIAQLEKRLGLLTPTRRQ